MTFRKIYIPAAWLAFLIIEPYGCEMNMHSNHEQIKFRDAVMYNQYIVERHKELFEDLNTYNLASEHDYNFALKMLDTIYDHASKSLDDIQILSPYKNDSSFREVSKDLFNYYSKIFVDDSKKLIFIKQRIDSGAAAKGDYESFDQLVKKIYRQSAPIETRLEEIQLRFARKNNFTLTKNSNDNE